MASKDGSRNRKTTRTMDYFFKHPYATNVEAAKACAVSLRTATLSRQKAVASGLIKASFYDHMPKIPKLPTSDTSTDESIEVKGTEELLRLAEEESRKQGKEWTTVDQLEFMWKIAHDPTEGTQIRMAAVSQYNKIKTDVGARDALGPGKPLTEEDKVIRLSLLMQACGKQTVNKALEHAFGKELPSGAPKTVDLRDDTTETTETPSTT